MKKEKNVLLVKNRAELETAERMIPELANDDRITKEEIHERWITFETAKTEWIMTIYRSFIGDGLLIDKLYYSESLKDKKNEFVRHIKNENNMICIELK